MPVAVKGSGGGGVTLDAGAASSDTTLTLPNVNGAVIATAPGTSGQVLTSNGSAWISAAPGGSGLTLIATLTPTSGTTQAVTGLASYTNLLVLGSNVACSAAQGMNLAVSSDNGSTYGATDSASNSASSHTFAVTIYGTALSTTTARIGFSTSGGGSSISSRAFATNSAAPVNAVRLGFSTSTFTGGAIYIYGWG